MSASVSSRELLEVRTTIGCVRASITPSSGIEIWKSERTSSSIASNSWSVLSISSISSTTGSVEAIASSSGRVRRKSSEKMSLRAFSQRRSRRRRLRLDPQQLLAVVPLVQRLGLVQALVALQADQPASGRPGERLGELGLADAGRALDQHRLAQALREIGDERGGLVGEIADALELRLDLGDVRLGCSEGIRPE